MHLVSHGGLQCNWVGEVCQGSKNISWRNSFHHFLLLWESTWSVSSVVSLIRSRCLQRMTVTSAVNCTLYTPSPDCRTPHLLSCQYWLLCVIVWSIIWKYEWTIEAAELCGERRHCGQAGLGPVGPHQPVQSVGQSEKSPVMAGLWALTHNMMSLSAMIPTLRAVSALRGAQGASPSMYDEIDVSWPLTILKSPWHHTR